MAKFVKKLPTKPMAAGPKPMKPDMGGPGDNDLKPPKAKGKGPIKTARKSTGKSSKSSR